MTSRGFEEPFEWAASLGAPEHAIAPVAPTGAVTPQARASPSGTRNTAEAKAREAMAIPRVRSMSMEARGVSRKSKRSQRSVRKRYGGNAIVLASENENLD